MQPSAWSYCTYFDSGYLSRGLSLIQSLREHGDFGKVLVLALDDAAFEYLSDAELDGVAIIRAADLERYEPRLLSVATERSRAEYIFTMTPHLIRYAIDHFAAPDEIVAYLDADLFFFQSGQAVATALGTGSVGIIPHRYPKRLEAKLAKYGTYNVGWLGFRNDARGRSVLDWYSTATIDWCADVPENGRYADQGYLDEFHRFAGVRVLDSAGFNLAPWNAARHELSVGSHGELLADREPLVFFHFHGLKKWHSRYISAHTLYGSRMGRLMREHVYAPYVSRLEANERQIMVAGVQLKSAARRGVGLRGTVFRLVKLGQTLLSVMQGNSVRVPTSVPEN